MVVAQLVERSLPIPDVRSLNPVVCQTFIEHLFIVNDENKEIKRPGMAY